MKKISILILLILSPKYIKADIFDNIADAFKDLGNKIADVAKKTAEGVVVAGKKIVDCTKIVGLGVADTAMKAGAPIIEAAKKSTSAVAFETAKEALKAAQKTTGAILDLTGKILEDITKNFQITCVRFFGTFDNIQIEIKGTVLGKNLEIKDKLKASSPEDLAKQIYSKILDMFNIKNIF